MSPATPQRRQHERYPTDREVYVEIGGKRLRGRLTDISDGGAFIRLSIEVEVGDAVRLALNEPPAAAHADVRRVADEGFAIRFDQETVGRIMREAAWRGSGG